MKIICIGRNYVEHAKELNNPVPTKPMFFVKPDTSLLRTHMFYIPPFSNNIHYELELVVKINKVGKSISKRFAHKYQVDGIVNEYATSDKPWEIEGAVFVDRETKLIVKGDDPPIHDFSIESDALGDITDSVLAASDATILPISVLPVKKI